MGLRKIDPKQEYRTDRNDIIREFLVPCLSSCQSYDRSVEYMSLAAIGKQSLGFDALLKNSAKMRMITGHWFGAYDLQMISKLYGPKNMSNKERAITSVNIVEQMLAKDILEVKVAVPSSEEMEGSFTENVGIFVDSDGDAVAFSGTSNYAFGMKSNFETITVFTSWDDGSRVDTKMNDFEHMWENRTKHLDVYSFEEAIKNNLLKYSYDWAISGH